MAILPKVVNIVFAVVLASSSLAMWAGESCRCCVDIARTPGLLTENDGCCPKDEAVGEPANCHMDGKCGGHASSSDSMLAGVCGCSHDNLPPLSEPPRADYRTELRPDGNATLCQVAASPKTAIEDFLSVAFDQCNLPPDHVPPYLRNCVIRT